MHKRITIATVCLNAANVLERTILSILNQTYKNIEYVIIDGASTDGTLDIIEKYREKISYFISEPDRGVYDAMNKAIRVATGEWIIFMNAGDAFASPYVLDKVFISDYNGYDVIFGDTITLMNGKYYQRECRPFYEHLPLHQSMGFVHQSSFVRSCRAKQFPFDLRFKLASDYNMMINLYKHGSIFYYIHEPIAFYEGNGLSDIRMKQHLKELFEVDYPGRWCNGIFSLRRYYVNTFKRLLKPRLFKLFPNFMRLYAKSRMGLNEVRKDEE